MTLRSRRKPPTTALNLTARRATEFADSDHARAPFAFGLILLVFSLAFALPTSAETKQSSLSKVQPDVQPKPATEQSAADGNAVVQKPTSTLKIKATSAEQSRIPLRQLSGKTGTTQMRVVSYGSGSKSNKWEPNRPQATLSFAKDSNRKSGWTRSTGRNQPLNDTSTHLNWGVRKDGTTVPPNTAAANQTVAGKTVFRTNNELPRLVNGSIRTPMSLSSAGQHRDFGATLRPPMAPSLSTIPKIATGENNSVRQAKSTANATRLQAVSSQAARRAVHVSTPKVEPQKPVHLSEPVAHVARDNGPLKAKPLVAKTSATPPLVPTGATASAKEVTKPVTAPKLTASKTKDAKPVAKTLQQPPKKIETEKIAKLGSVAQSPAKKTTGAVQPAQHIDLGQPRATTTQPIGGRFATIPFKSKSQEQLRLPIANLRNGSSWQPKQTNAPFSAPLPSQQANDPNARQTRVAERFRFKDLTPLTKPVQGPGPSDDFFDPPSNSESSGPSFSLDDLSPAGDGDASTALGDSLPEPEISPLNPLPPAPGASPEAKIDLDKEFADPLGTPDGLPALNEPNSLPLDGADSPSDRNFSILDRQEPSGELEDVEELRKQIQEQLNELQELPEVEDDGQDPLDLDNVEDDSSPLFSNEEPAKTSEKIGELSETNGRDCEAHAESCRKDLEYLDRRQRTSNISLNISPLLSPAELDMAKSEQTRVDKMAKTPRHTWRDRAGTVLADGQLDDFRDGQVIVRTVNGSFRKIPHHKLSDKDRCYVAAYWEMPLECNFEGERYEMRDFRLTTFTWAAAGTCHKSLYFEQVGVERYGHSAGPIVQPLISSVHFFGDIFMLPYHAGIHPPNECVYTLGHYRPGNCAPWLMPGFPITDRSIKWQGVALGAAITLLP